MKFGDVVAAARGAIPLRVLAGRLGFSHTFLHDVEKGRRRLPVGRWVALVRQLAPELTLEQLAAGAVAPEAGSVEINTRLLTDEQRLVLAAVLVAEAQEAERSIAGAA